MTILVCGDREWVAATVILEALIEYGEGDVLIHGDCRGADRLAGEAGRGLGMAIKTYPALWHLEGRAAGPLRNQRMLDENPSIDLVLAFHDHIGHSRGTADMVRRARRRSIPVRILTSDGPVDQHPGAPGAEDRYTMHVEYGLQLGDGTPEGAQAAARKMARIDGVEGAEEATKP